MKQPAHSLLGASGAYRWLNCPGSFQLSLTTPPRPSSIYAVTGTIAHDYIEKAVRDAMTQGRRPGELMVDQRELNRVWSREGHAVTVDQDFIDGINVMLDYVNGAADLSDWVNVEFRIELDDYFPKANPPPVNLFGRVDVALLDLLNETLEVVDYKNGSGVMVTPRENPQLMYYAAGVLKQLPANQFRQIKHVKLTVVQPHAPGVEPVRYWETSVLDLLIWVDDVLVPGVHACAKPDPVLVPGSWCRFCPALHACPRLMQDAVDMAKREFDDVKLPDDPDELAKALDIAERALTWAGALQAHALEQLQRQVRIPGWEMVPTRPTRRWIDEETTTVGVLSTLGVGDDVIWETRLRSPAQVEKALTKSTKGRHLWQDQIADILIESKSSGVKLARSQRADAKGEFQDAE
jgi:hypothetical protein